VLSSITFCLRKDRKLKPIVDKNLDFHYSRNSKTSLLFSVSLAFLIFSSAMFDQIQILSLKLFDSVIGADMAVMVLGGNGVGDDVSDLGLNSFLAEEPIVQDFAYFDQPLNRVLSPEFNKWKGISMGFKGIEMLGIKLYSLDEKLLEIADTRYFWPQGIYMPEYLGREYEDIEIMQMMEDMEPYSWFERQLD
jgi:hypothetical protein